MKMRVLVTSVALVASAWALDWVETGPIPGALNITELAVGPDSCLYAAVNSADSGFVYKSTDGNNWTRCGVPPGYVRAIYALEFGRGDTLFAGTRATFGGADTGRLYSSADFGATWQHRSSIGGTVAGLRITALLEDDSGYIYAGHDYFDGARGYPPCRSTDRGYTWTQAPSISTYSAYDYVILQSAGIIYCATWGYRGLVMKSTNHGASWTATAEVFDAGHTTSLIEGPGGVLYACTYPKVVPQEPIGRVFKTTNQGGTWTEIGHGYFDATSGLRPLCLVSDSALYVASEPAGIVFVSYDWGTTWINAGTLPGAAVTYRLRQAKMAGVNYLYAATGSNGKVFRATLDQVGAREMPNAEVRIPNCGATVARGVLNLRFPIANRQPAVLLDAAGRNVLELRAGENDVRSLAPGVYFVSGVAPAVRRVVVTR